MRCASPAAAVAPGDRARAEALTFLLTAQDLRLPGYPATRLPTGRRLAHLTYRATTPTVATACSHPACPPPRPRLPYHSPLDPTPPLAQRNFTVSLGSPLLVRAA